MRTLMVNLSECRFRFYWDRTANLGHERLRFADIQPRKPTMKRGRPLTPCRPRNFSKRNMHATCGSCGIDAGWNGLGEWYTVRDCVWEQVWPGTSNSNKPAGKLTGLRYFLCIGCLEERLGRKLT